MNETSYRESESRLWNTVGIQPDEKMVTLETTGTKVRVQMIGDGPPVLFIHGGPNSGSTWAPVVKAFDDYTCLLVDRPGTGLSEPLDAIPDPTAFITLAEQFIADTLDGLHIESSHIVASSLGGHIALRSVAAAPERVGRMVQMACPALVQGMLTPQFMRMMSKGWFRKFLGMLPPSSRANDSIMRQIGHGKSLDAGRIPQEFMDWYLDLQRFTNTMENDGNLIGAFSSGGTWNDRLTLSDELLSSVIVPTLFLWGEDDGFGGGDVADALVGAMPNAELEMIAEAGHLPWLDFPADIGARTRAFLDEGA